MINLEDFDKHMGQSRQILFDYFEDFTQVELLQTYLYQKGWKLVEIERNENVTSKA